MLRSCEVLFYIWEERLAQTQILFTLKFIGHYLKVSHRPHIHNCWVTIFRTEYVGIFIAYIRTEAHMPRSNCSYVITMKPKTKYKYRAAVFLVILHLTGTNTLTKVACFSERYYLTKCHDLVALVPLPYHKFRQPYVGITDGKKFNITSVEWRLVAWCSDQIF